MPAAAERRAREQERMAAAVRALLTSEGWRRWAAARARFRRYSLANTLLIAAQRPDATRVAGYRAWRELGRQVRRGERAIRIWAPTRRRERDPETGEEVEFLHFVVVSVFDLAQTEGPPLPEAPVAPTEGDSHAHLIPRMKQLARALGYEVRFGPVPGGAEGLCDERRRVILARADRPANARLATLTHEVAHALGVTYRDRPRHEAEVIVETAAAIALAGAGLDTAGESVPYLASWAERDPEAMERTAATVGEIAARLEEALGLDAEDAQDPPASPQVDDGTAAEERPATPPAHRRSKRRETATRLHMLCGVMPRRPLW
jgi:antirestriction protein ArdC